MTPRQETIYKWGLYALATLACCVFQRAVLQYMTIFGVFPFLYPVLAAVLATLEGPRSGSVYALVLGAVCDLTIHAPIPCFYTLVFPLIGISAGAAARKLLSSDLLSALTSSAAAFLLTGVFHGTIFALSSHPAWAQVISLCGRELIISVPLALPVFFLFRLVWRRCLSDPVRRG